jgi:hypothetical protein
VQFIQDQSSPEVLQPASAYLLDSDAIVPESVERISWWRQIDFATVPDHDLNTEIECV